MIILSNIQKLYDGRSSGPDSVHRGVDLAIDGSRIAFLEPHRAERLCPEGTRILPAENYVVTPGIIDCHSHITALGLSGKDVDLANTPAAMVYVEKILHTSLVDGGVTSLRDVGGATHMMKRLVDEGVMIGPRVFVSICMLSSTGGHADFRGPDRCHAEVSRLWPPAPGRPSSIVDGPWECRKRVREIAACGADLIKLCTSPGVASPSDHLEHRDFTAEEIAAICDEARGRGLKVAAHAHSQSGIELAIENGVSDIQHISFMDERLVEMAHAHDCTVTPTSWVIRDLMEAEGIDPFVMEKVKKVAEVHTRAVEHARSGGLRILAGTDPVLPGMHGRNYMELVHLMKDGLTSLEAWHGATGLAADEIGIEGAGRLEAGALADLIVADQDVVEDPEHFDRGALVEVLKEGVGHRGGIDGIPLRTFSDTVQEVLS